MGLQSRLQNIRSEAWKRVKEAVSENNINKSRLYHEIIQEGDQLLEEIQNIIRKTKMFEEKAQKVNINFEREIPSKTAPSVKVENSKRRPRDTELEAELKLSLGLSLKKELKEDFYQKGKSQLIFSRSGKKFLLRYSSFQREQLRWFWGVSRKYWDNWDYRDNLVLILENKDCKGFSYLLFDSQESKELFRKCSESDSGDKKINMRIYVKDNSVKIQEWQELVIEGRIKPLFKKEDTEYLEEI